MGVISLRFSNEEETQIQKSASKEKVSKYLKRKILEPKAPKQNENIGIKKITMMMHSINDTPKTVCEFRMMQWKSIVNYKL